MTIRAQFFFSYVSHWFHLAFPFQPLSKYLHVFFYISVFLLAVTKYIGMIDLFVYIFYPLLFVFLKLMKQNCVKHA